MKSSETVDLQAPGVLEALARATEFRLIGLLLERPSGQRRQRILELIPGCDDLDLRERAGRLASAAESDYVSLFGPGGPSSPREAAYIGRRDPARAMAEVSSLYEAFAFRPALDEPVDHMAVETAFASWLSFKQAYALARGDAEAAGITAAVLQTFLREHLAVLAGGLATRMASCPDPDLVALVTALLVRTGGRPLPEAELDGGAVEEEMSCGMCEDPEKAPPERR